MEIRTTALRGQSQGFAMDEMIEFEHGGWQFLCSAERLPSGLYQAVVRYRTPGRDDIGTAKIDPVGGIDPAEALERAKELAVEWAANRAARPGHK